MSEHVVSILRVVGGGYTHASGAAPRTTGVFAEKNTRRSTDGPRFSEFLGQTDRQSGDSPGPLYAGTQYGVLSYVPQNPTSPLHIYFSPERVSPHVCRFYNKRRAHTAWQYYWNYNWKKYKTYRLKHNRAVFILGISSLRKNTIFELFARSPRIEHENTVGRIRDISSFTLVIDTVRQTKDRTDRFLFNGKKHKSQRLLVNVFVVC